MHAGNRMSSSPFFCLLKFLFFLFICLMIKTPAVNAAKQYTITASAGSNGSISPSGAVSVSSGGSKTFTVTPNTGYHISAVVVDGNSQGAITSYTFSNVTANHTISATFAINTYTITATAGNGGTVTPATATVNSGGSQTFTITPDTGYSITNVTVDSVSQGVITSYTFSNVTANHTITASFAVNAPTSSVSYFYDDLGRLSRISQGTNAVIYNYDELGNLLSVSNASTSNASPVITGISPDILFVGTKIPVTITGQNLLTMNTVTSTGGQIAIDNIRVTDSQITADMTALSNGTDSIRVTTTNGYAQVGVTLSSSKITFNPGQLSIIPGGSATITVSVSPPLGTSLTIPLSSSSTGTVTVPQYITIPTSGAIDFTVNALQLGATTVSSGGTETVVFVANPFTGSMDHLTANSISVVIDSPPGNSSTGTAPVSVTIDAPSGSSTGTSDPVSVAFDAASGSSTGTSNPVSVSIDAPPGNSTTAAGPVSVQIQ